MKVVQSGSSSLNCFVSGLIFFSLLTLLQPVVRADPGNRLQPEDLVYLGAFRLPDAPGTPENVGWEWSNWAGAATSYPQGDPSGPHDGFPGSLYATGHDQTQYVAEITIPVPVRSLSRNIQELNTSSFLQSFHDIRGDLYPSFEMPRVGLEYLPPLGEQSTGKLYFSWAEHLDEENTGPTHGWCELDLNTPASVGTWRIGGQLNYVTADYLFTIPSTWADSYVAGFRLATGRYRDGGQGAQGPSLFAIAPWRQGNPPAAGTTLAATKLLLYDKVTDPVPQSTLEGYSHADEWNGGAWLTSGTKSAVIFVGNKGVGSTWYGCVDGEVCPPDCDCGESRGWWADQIRAQMIFYDTNQLADVALGRLQPGQPQPYAVMNLDPFLFHITSTRQKHHVSAVACDQIHGLLYIFEPLVDNDKPLVHVWRFSDASTGSGPSSGVGSVAPIIHLLGSDREE